MIDTGMSLSLSEEDLLLTAVTQDSTWPPRKGLLLHGMQIFSRNIHQCLSGEPALCNPGSTGNPFWKSPHHVQLAIVSCEGWHGVGGQSAGCQRVVGVHGRAVLVVSMGRDGRVETRPEHPQVDSTCERRGRRCYPWLQWCRQAIGDIFELPPGTMNFDWEWVKCVLKYILMV